jgi:hypothetical protein
MSCSDCSLLKKWKKEYGSDYKCKLTNCKSYRSSSRSSFNPRSRADEYELSCYYDTFVDNKKW